MHRRHLAWGLCMALAAGPAGAGDPAEAFAAARILADRGEYTAALDLVADLLAADPDRPDWLLARAAWLESSGDPDRAVAQLEEMTRRYPDLPEPHNNLAVHYARAGDYDRAIRSLEAALGTHAGYAAAWRNLSAVYAHLARDAYRRALDTAAPPDVLRLEPLDSVHAPGAPRP